MKTVGSHYLHGFSLFLLLQHKKLCGAATLEDLVHGTGGKII